MCKLHIVILEPGAPREPKYPQEGGAYDPRFASGIQHENQDDRATCLGDGHLLTLSKSEGTPLSSSSCPKYPQPVGPKLAHTEPQESLGVPKGTGDVLGVDTPSVTAAHSQPSPACT